MKSLIVIGILLAATPVQAWEIPTYEAPMMPMPGADPNRAMEDAYRQQREREAAVDRANAEAARQQSVNPFCRGVPIGWPGC